MQYIISQIRRCMEKTRIRCMERKNSFKLEKGHHLPLEVLKVELLEAISKYILAFDKDSRCHTPHGPHASHSDQGAYPLYQNNC